MAGRVRLVNSPVPLVELATKLLLHHEFRRMPTGFETFPVTCGITRLHGV